MSSPDETPPTSTADTSRRRGRIIAVAVGLVAVAAVVLALVLTGRGDDSPGAGGSPEPSAGSSSASSTGGGTASAEPTDGPADELPAAGPDTPEAPPVAFDESPTVLTGVTARVKSVTAVDGDATLPGEVAGPAVLAELELTNDSGTAIDLSTTVVNLAYGADRIPANTFSTGTSSFVGSLDTGSSATASYVFAVPTDEQDVLRLTLDYAVDVPVVVFEGAAS
ncbi:hypothetical protein [Frigoribacterium sp. PvP032]|uniref:hypothetical protein n=1 Tax=Frigoribacterium sp. PvP032 TaxID=2806589 RepID=UPI001AE64F4C|nr:hypothetical protein [Frigoribacterium sp. PvP032]MBP1191893.1 hypothetical protein [Frigoribacterium sp. PvP032]